MTLVSPTVGGEVTSGRISFFSGLKESLLHVDGLTMAKSVWFGCLLLLASVLGACGGEPDHRVLFVGNSFTHGNNMPDMVEEIADANGAKIEWTMIAPGGAYLDEHQYNTEVVTALRSGNFDTVVFQEQSVITSVPDMVASRTLPAARTLDSIADAAGVRVIWFQTWGHLNGFPDVGYSDYASMQRAISATYDQIAVETSASVARVGDRWGRTLGSVSVGLYSADGYHASPAGSYVAAIELAGSITGVSIVEAPSVDGVESDVAEILVGA